MSYTDMLAAFGIGSAHPGGFSKSRQMLMEMDISEQTVILDCGCGTGQTSAYINQLFNCQITAIEPHPLMAAKARKRFKEEWLNIPVLNKSIENSGLPSNQFDYVICESVLSFVSLEEALGEIHRLLKPNGLLFANELSCLEPLSNGERAEIMSHYSFQTLNRFSDWAKIVERSGFSQATMIEEVSAAELQQDESDKGNDMIPSRDIPQHRFDQVSAHAKMMQLYGHKIGHTLFKAKADSGKKE
ncbi:LOW QUALITY PROTEIN: methyltransferase YodH [Bacillus sp. JCM 19045]|nr:LOW QUALITY PROTEIN: methyltransferase YodH [Bacillus sp. JCM 19045]